MDIKQNSQVTHLGCTLDETMSGEPIAYKTIKKVNSRLNYMFRKKCFWWCTPQTGLMQRIDPAAF